jgi:hypothetical protein
MKEVGLLLLRNFAFTRVLDDGSFAAAGITSAEREGVRDALTAVNLALRPHVERLVDGFGVPEGRVPAIVREGYIKANSYERAVSASDFVGRAVTK